MILLALLAVTICKPKPMNLELARDMSLSMRILHACQCLLRYTDRKREKVKIKMEALLLRPLNQCPFLGLIFSHVPTTPHKTCLHANKPSLVENKTETNQIPSDLPHNQHLKLHLNTARVVRWLYYNKLVCACGLWMKHYHMSKKRGVGKCYRGFEKP